MDKILCCRKGTEGKGDKSQNESVKSNGVRTEQPQPETSWNIGHPLSDENQIGVEPFHRKHEHIELSRLTSDASRLHDPMIEPAEDLDPNVVEEVSGEDLARYSTDLSPATTPSAPSTSREPRDGFTDVDLDAEVPIQKSSSQAGPSASARSIEEVALEYNRSKREILKEIEKEEDEIEDVISIKPQTHSMIPKLEVNSPKTPIPVNDEDLNKIEEEFKEIMEELEEESDDELRKTIEKRASISQNEIRETLCRVQSKTQDDHSDIDSPSPLSSRGSNNNDKTIHDRSFDDSDIEHLIVDDSARTQSSLPPPPVIDIPASSISNSSHITAPLSSSSGFVTSTTMYSAASDDSDVSDGEEVPRHKRIYDVSSDEGIEGNETSVETTVLHDDKVLRSGTTISLNESGEATVASGDVRIALSKERSVTITDDEFSEKLV